MATVASPYGLIPVKKLGGQVYNGSSSHMWLAAANATSIYTGDLVRLLNSSGFLTKDTGTTTATPVGVFVGCEYTDPNLKYRVFRSYYPASTTPPNSENIKVYVVDDPDVIFKIQSDGSTTLTQSFVGTNAALIQGAGSTTTGLSGVSFAASTIANTAALPLKLIALDTTPNQISYSTTVTSGIAAVGDAYVDVWCMINMTTHWYRTALANSS